MAFSTYEPFMVAYPGGLNWPTPVEMKSFRAIADERSVLLEWATAHEIDNAGFHLYRATSPEGLYARINGPLIPGQGYSVRGADYQFTDEGVETGVTYYYKLEDVDFRGNGTFHGPVWATPGGDRDGDGMPDWWEEKMGLDPDVDDARLDYDGDGLSNLEEFFYGFNPFDFDTDGNGVPDELEIGDSESDGKTGGEGGGDKTEGDGDCLGNRARGRKGIPEDIHSGLPSWVELGGRLAAGSGKGGLARGSGEEGFERKGIGVRRGDSYRI
jgi:hypothetical protein